MIPNTNEYAQTRAAVGQAMSIFQTILDELYRKDVLKGCTGPEAELISALEAHYKSGEELIASIDAVINDIPPWEERVPG